eukprot:m.123105 g.123105  ORF g.123105 m.123105 type:complete len:1130 (-) comp15670_c0_seq2:15-3404(-)
MQASTPQILLVLALLAPVDVLARKPASEHCGTSTAYWSTSCGPIGSALSRFCSDGGYLVNEMACATHFQPGSRACGALMLGCSSLCSLEEIPCQQGVVGFAHSKSTLCVVDSVLQGSEFVTRSSGIDTDINVTAIVTYMVRDTEEIIHQHRQTLSWTDQDAEPKAVWLNVSMMQHPFGTVAAYLRLVDPTGDVRLGLSHMETILDNTQLGGGIFVPTQTEYLVSEDQQMVTVAIERQQADPETSASVEVALLGSTGTNRVDFELPTRQRLYWHPHSEAKQTIQMRVSNNHEHEPSDVVYIGLFEARGAVLPAHSQVIKVVITDSQNAPMHNQTAIRLAKLRDMPWIEEITNMHARLRFLDAWQMLPTRPKQEIAKENEVADMVFVLSDGKYRFESQRVSKVLLETAGRGAIVGLLSARYQQPAPLRVICKSYGQVWAMSREVLALHNITARQDIYGLMRHHVMRMLVVKNPNKFPIMLFPGFMSSRLLAWSHKACGGRDVLPLDQVWLSLEKLVQTLVVDGTCWLNCLALGPHQEDSDCKLRPAQDISAVSELSSQLVGVTTIFRTLIEFYVNNWGYESSTMIGMPYDWRLSPKRLSMRDDFFNQVKLGIEKAYLLNRMPAILIGHSLGNMVIGQFFQWLQVNFPRKYLAWTAKHVVSYYSIAPPLLGAPSAAYAALIGDNMGLPITAGQSRGMGSTFGSVPWMQPVSARMPDEKRPYPKLHKWSGKGATTLRLRDVIGGPDNYSATEATVWRVDLARNQSTTPTQFRFEHTPVADLLSKHFDVDFDSKAPQVSDSAHKPIDTTQDAKLRDPPPTPDGMLDEGWMRYILNVTFYNGSSHSYSVEDFATGQLFQEFASFGNDSMARNIYESFVDDYRETSLELNPHFKRPSRPPVRQVAVIYGVNVRTKHFIGLQQAIPGGPYAPQIIHETTDGQLQNSKGRVIGSTGLRKSGDGSVPYASLSWAHAWHLTDDVRVTYRPSRMKEYYQHLLGKWGEQNVLSLMNTVEPETHRFDSYEDGFATTVVEVDGLEHRRSVMSPVTLRILDSLMQELIQHTLCFTVSQYGFLGLEPEVPTESPSLSRTSSLDQLLSKTAAAIQVRKKDTASQDTIDLLDETYAALLRLQNMLPPS